VTIGPRFAVLAVCTANICRSPIMEILLRERLDRERFEVASAGVRGWDRQPMDPSAATELQRLGHASDTFRSHPIDSYLVESADLVLTATREHRSEVLAVSPKALRRTFTLLEFAALAELTELVEAGDPEALVARAAQRRSLAPTDVDVRDPYRRGADVHRATADQIDAAVATIAQRLNALVPTS
jgi:protein-tyrosine phosphatase